MHPRCFCIISALTLLVGCGGGGGSSSTPAPTPAPTPNQAPTASSIEVTTTLNRPVLIDVTTASSDPDGTINSLTIVESDLGTIETSGTVITYTPDDGFIGTDSFRFTVTDDEGAESNAATATITVEAVTATVLRVLPLTIPSTGYASLNQPEFGTVFSSPLQTFTLPPNTVSFSLMLRGSDTGSADGLIITDLNSPAGEIFPLGREVILCDVLLCSAYLPRRPGQTTPAGEWTYRLGTTNGSLDGIDLANLTLELAVRSGPGVDATAAFPATLPVRPHLTATSVSPAEFEAILTEFVAIAADSGINVELRPTRMITAPEFVEVSSEFEDATTAALIRQGDPDAANLFFIESFTGSGGRIGIAPGIPGTFGVRSELSGVIINATISQSETPAVYARTTAEFAFHEMGHLLGLFHTTETDFSHDILEDTPNCVRADDSNDNNRPDTAECADGLNPMFWTNDFDTPKAPLTPDQRSVLYFSPLASP